MKKTLTLGALLLIVLGFLSFFYLKNPKNTSGTILAQIKSQSTTISWDVPEETTDQTSSGNIKGEKISGILTTAQATLPHFEDAQILTKAGFEPDMSLSADGPGSSVWGYKKKQGGQQSLIIFSYKTLVTSQNPNEPLQFNCPCNMSVSVFVSDPFKTGGVSNKSGLPNPASVNCAKQGGTDTIETLNNGAQYGLCQFEDNMACEEWALLRGQCPKGGVKTAGYDTMGQKYCAWLGGKTFAVPNSKCTLPNGKVCPTEALYNGTCSST